MEVQEGPNVAFVTLYARIVNELAKNPRVAQETLARRLDVTMRTVQRHLGELERESFVQVDRNRKPYRYDIAWDRPLPYFKQLRVELFRPDTIEKLSRNISKT